MNVNIENFLDIYYLNTDDEAPEIICIEVQGIDANFLKQKLKVFEKNYKNTRMDWFCLFIHFERFTLVLITLNKNLERLQKLP